MAKHVQDGVELLSDGRIRLVVDGESVVLRRPKIKELRRLQDLLMDVINAERESKGLAEQLAVQEGIATYWSEAIAMLGDGGELPDADDLPVWLVSAVLINDAQTHWREVPYLSGGK